MLRNASIGFGGVEDLRLVMGLLLVSYRGPHDLTDNEICYESSRTLSWVSQKAREPLSLYR